MSNIDLKVDASPTKNFFIHMLTRDIDLRAAILELIDNSIDGAKAICKTCNYTGLWIKIDINKDGFCIEDNCSGISVDTAQKYAFKFGRSEERPMDKDNYMTGIFGIGMKRTLFKLGKQFSVYSKTKDESFDLNVDVNEWVNSPYWNFELTKVERGVDNKETGTKIVVTNLNPDVASRFSSQYFVNSVIDYVQKYRSVEAENGLEIIINDHTVSYGNETLIESQDIKSYKCIINDSQGTIRIIAGITSKGSPERAGWYIYCNGRIVLYADKTNLTGWGDGALKFHNEVAEFRGYVYFESKDLLALPWNTTKTGIDATNRMYLIAKEKMIDGMNQVFQGIRSAKAKYSVKDLEEVSFIKKSQKMELNRTSLSQLTKDEDFEIKEVEAPIPMTTISFKKPTEEVDIVKQSMDEKVNKRVGERLFEYYFEMEDL